MGFLEAHVQLTFGVPAAGLIIVIFPLSGGGFNRLKRALNYWRGREVNLFIV